MTLADALRYTSARTILTLAAPADDATLAWSLTATPATDAILDRPSARLVPTWRTHELAVNQIGLIRDF